MVRQLAAWAMTDKDYDEATQCGLDDLYSTHRGYGWFTASECKANNEAFWAKYVANTEESGRGCI